jgi:hypothetical protein
MPQITQIKHYNTHNFDVILSIAFTWFHQAGKIASSLAGKTNSRSKNISIQNEAETN